MGKFVDDSTKKKMTGKPKKTAAEAKKAANKMGGGVQWAAQWIWDGGEASPRNYYLAARREFSVDGESLRAERRIHISADARYRLYLNGEWLGDGPARSFYMHQQFDTYDVTGLLRPGKNTLAAIATHYGEGTFQYTPSGQAGLLVQLERREGNGWTAEVVSDESWAVRRHEGYERPTSRISCQMPFMEIFDAQALSPEWTLSGGTGKGFAKARVVGPAGSGPWTELVARSVPFLTRTPHTPVRFLRTGLTRPANFTFGFSSRPYMLPGYFMQNGRELKGFAATRIVSPKAQEIQLFTLTGRYEMPIINGEVKESGSTFTLRSGENLMLIPFNPGGHHEFDRIYPAFIERPVELKGVFNEQTAWTIFGPFENWKELFEEVKKVGTIEGLEPYRDKAQVVKQEDIITAGSPWMETTVAQRVEGEAKIEHPEAFFNDDSSMAVIHPSAKGDVELFLDFGKELVGYLDFEIEALAGTVLDFNGLEEIEDGKRFHFTSGNECGMRYITREGRQQYTSFQRRGYRYLMVVFRNMSGPVRVRRMQTLFSIYPSVERGSFDCSDSLLTRIWEVGRHTLRCCSEDTFTDCPTYEQTYWVGDARNESLINYATFGDLPLTRRCAELPAESLFRAPIPESQVPSAWDNLLPAWSFLWVQMADEFWQFSGDKEYLRNIYPAVRTTLKNCREKFTDERGLFSIEAWNFFDWAGLDDPHKMVTHNQMFLAESYRRAAVLAQVLGKEKDAEWFTGERTALIEAINTHLWDKKREAYIDSIHDDGTPSEKISQQTNSLAVLYDIASGKRMEKIRRVPAEPREDMTKVGSPFALFYILEALIKEGNHEAVVRIVRERWGEMIYHGATTFWEMFPGFWGDWWSRSYCHAWSSAPVYFLTRYQLGVWWNEPGYKTARIAPVPLDLTWAKGRVPTPSGEVAASWVKKDDAFTMELALPAGTGATVVLPVSAAEYSEVEAEGVEFKKVKDAWTCELPAGAAVSITARKAEKKHGGKKGKGKKKK